MKQTLAFLAALLVSTLGVQTSSLAAEQRPNVIFIVDPLTEPAGDWATWVTPRIVLR